ncbi:MAG: class I SAM-dependent methyltransferase [Anaerolineaceae bacterium]|jgi:ubiquinone/menaquinone biosynthesis C-methylase UbiE|nr:class I SAM-dependent methyltransferase [Anaerolineaceae bacterium]
MAKIDYVNDPAYIKKQYENADNLNVRIRLHEQFSTNKQGWQPWLFDRFAIAPGMRVLELGCGPGNLWLENLQRLPEDVEIVLSDFSEGMLGRAQDALAEACPRFDFKVIDAQEIPFEDDSFDVVLANHMLYHVPDRRKAFAEVRRVLKPGGRFYASTGGKAHMQELHALMGRFDASLLSWGKSAAAAFCLENGAEQIGEFFNQVTMHRYEDSLRVTDADMLLAYILSGRLTLDAEQQAALEAFVRQEVAASPQGFFITKDSGLFEAV